MVRTSDILLLTAGIRALVNPIESLKNEMQKDEVNRVKVFKEDKESRLQAIKDQKDLFQKDVKLYQERVKQNKIELQKESEIVNLSELTEFYQGYSAKDLLKESEDSLFYFQNKIKGLEMAETDIQLEKSPDLPKGSGMGGTIATAVAALIIKGLEDMFNKFMAPGQELSKELKTAGLPSMVKAFNTVADPLIDMAEIISDSISPAFIPMIEKLAEGMGGLLQPIEGNAEGLSKMDVLVRDITPVMTSAGDALVQLVPQIPSMITLWVKFAAVNWEGIATFMINNGDKILFVLERTVTILDNIYSALNGINDFTLPKLLIGNERSFGGAGNYYGRDT
jgi:hypothetical protein